MTNESIKDYYRHIEKYDWVDDTRYPAKLFHQMRAKHIVELANDFIGCNSKVIDLGCGTGLITRNLRGHVTGLDINTWALERAKGHCPDTVTFMPADSEHLPFPNDAIDVVVCSDMLEHLFDVNKTLSEIHRVLRKDGFLIGEVPAKTWIWHYRRLFGSTYKGKEPVHRNYTVLEVEHMLWEFKQLAIKQAVLGTEISFVVRKRDLW